MSERKRKLIYYPSILVPARWQRMTVLYWDKISSIVPEQWDDEVRLRPNFGDPQADRSYLDMKYLESEGEYEPIRPENVPIHLKNEFARRIDSLRLSKGNKSNQEVSYFPLHKGKTTGQLCDLLRDKKLVYNGLIDENWIYVEKDAYLLYMSLLAKYLADYCAKREGNYIVTGTDSEDYETMAFKGTLENNRVLSYDINFQNILPIPADNVPMQDILAFKQEREDELLRFRKVLDETIDKIKSAINQNEINRIQIQQEEQLKVEYSILLRSMKYSGIKATLTSFKSLIGQLGISGVATHNHLLAGGIGAIGIFSAWIDSANEQRAKALDLPYSYLYYADRAGILDLSYLRPRKRNFTDRLSRLL